MSRSRLGLGPGFPSAASEKSQARHRSLRGVGYANLTQRPVSGMTDARHECQTIEKESLSRATPG